MKFKLLKKRLILYVSLLLLGAVIIQVSPVEAKLWDKINPVKVVKRTKKKIEVAGGWDRYIYAWGDRFVPNERRWVAIRSAQKNGKRDMGNFWDIPGRGRQVEGANKELKLWPLGAKFQESPKRDRRYRFIPAWEVGRRDPGDFGYYYILCQTGYFVWAEPKRGGWMRVRHHFNNRNYPNDNSYKWKVENVGKNRFIIFNKASNLVIDAQGGKGNKRGTRLINWTAHRGACQQWEFILIAQGREVKSTGRMVKNRARDIARATSNLTNRAYNAVSNTLGREITKGVKGALSSLGKKLLRVDHTKNRKGGGTVFLKVGVENPADRLYELRDKIMSRFVSIDLKRFNFSLDRNKIRLSLINRIASLGQHVDLTFTFAGNWKLEKSGFKIYNFHMERFSIPFFPDRTTRGLRNSISGKLGRMNISIKHYPGEEIVKNIYRKSKNVRFRVKDVEKTRSKFTAKLIY